MKRLRAVLLPLFLVLLCADSATAQTITGAVTGTVTDPTGAVVPNAKVTATNTDTNLTYTTQTTQAGVYSILFLPIGSYTVAVEAQGFKKASLGPFTLEQNQTARLDVPLEVGDTTTTVEIQAVAPILQTESTATGDSLSSAKLRAFR